MTSHSITYRNIDPASWNKYLKAGEAQTHTCFWKFREMFNASFTNNFFIVTGQKVMIKQQVLAQSSSPVIISPNNLVPSAHVSAARKTSTKIILPKGLWAVTHTNKNYTEELLRFMLLKTKQPMKFPQRWSQLTRLCQLAFWGVSLSTVRATSKIHNVPGRKTQNARNHEQREETL